MIRWLNNFALGLVVLTSISMAQESINSYNLEQFRGKEIPAKLLDEVSVHIDNEPFEVALSSLANMGKIRLSYDFNLLPADKNVTIHEDNIYFIEALVKVIKGTGMSLEITKNGNFALIPADEKTGGSSSGRSSIRGVAVDRSTGEPLPGANVYLLGTSLGAATDINGEYIISNVPPGTYSICFKYIGYKDVEKDTLLRHGQSIIVNAEMSFAALKGDVVTITAQAEGQLEAINQQLSANSISNIVASDRIQEVPDANAGESVGRLPGVSLIRDAGEGNKVSIRGLAPHYNAISIDGIRMTSTSGGSITGEDLTGLDIGQNADRSVDLNMISSEMLSGIELIKAPTADRDADAMGGTVDFKFRQAPEDLHSNISLQGGYNSQQDKYNMLKFVGNISNRFLDNKFGIILQGSYDKANRGHDRLASIWSADLVNNKAFLERLTLSDVLEERFRYGGSVLLDYRLPLGKITYNTFYSRLNRKYVQRDNMFFNNAMARHRISKVESNTDAFSTALGLEHDMKMFSLDGKIGFTQTNQTIPYDRQLHFVQESAIEQTDPPFGELTPEQVLERYTFIGSNTRWDGTGGAVRSRDIEENELSFTTNINIPLTFFDGKISTNVKLGGKYRHKTRSQDLSELTLIEGVAGVNSVNYRNWILDNYPQWISSDKDDRQLEGTSVKMDGFLDGSYNPGTFLDGSFGFGPVISEKALDEVSQVYDAFDKIHATNSLANDHEGIEDIYAAYLMTEINIGKQWKFIPGIRYENFISEYTAPRTFQGYSAEVLADVQDTTVQRDNKHFFPMIHLRYSPMDWFDIRFAYTQTITRPQYSYFMPSIHTVEGGDTRAGNYKLKPATAENYDLYLSAHSNIIGLLTVGGFYKEIENLVWEINASNTASLMDIVHSNFLIPTRYFQSNNKNFISYLNNPYTAFVKGFELDWQTTFWYLPKPFNGLVLNMNYTHLQSKTKYIAYRTEVDRSSWPFTTTTIDTFRRGRMISQPNDIFNISLGYDLGGFSSRISFTYQGNTLTDLRSTALQDQYSEEYYRIDLKIMQAMPVEGLQAYLNVNNLIDSPEKSKQALKGYLTSASYYGLTVDIGLRYRL